MLIGGVWRKVPQHFFFFFSQPKLTNLSCWALAGRFWFHWNVRFNRGQRYSSWTGVSHHGRELVAPLAGPVGRTYTCFSPASSPPPYETNHPPKVTTMAPSHITTSQSVTAGINKAWLEAVEAMRRGFTYHKRLGKMLKGVCVSVGLCLPEFHLLHIHSDGAQTHTHPARRLLQVW